MSNENVRKGPENVIPPEYIDQAALESRLPASDPLVVLLAEARYKLSLQEGELHYLRGELDEAQKDPLTGFWLQGPGFKRLEELMSVVENNLAGLVDNPEDMPNSLLAVGLDVEGLHYTNNWYGQKGGNIRIMQAGSELRSVAEIIKHSARTYDRHGTARSGEEKRQPDLLIKTGGDEFLAVWPFRETGENPKEVMAERIVHRLSGHKTENAPNLRILYKVGFFVPGIGQTPEDLYNSVDPKAAMNRTERLVRPLFKVIRLGTGQYKPHTGGEL